MRNINKRDTKVCRQVSQLFWTRSGCQKCRAMISNLYFNNILLPPFKNYFPAFWTCVQSIVSLIIEGGVCYVLLVSVFPANIWLLFCIQSVWSDIVFWKQIKLIPKMHISNRYLEQKCCINNSWILSVFCANKLYQFLLFFISELNQTISYNFLLLPWRRGI